MEVQFQYPITVCVCVHIHTHTNFREILTTRLENDHHMLMKAGSNPCGVFL
jgi:hypothetical protein